MDHKSLSACRERERETHTYKIITPASMNVFAGMRREPLREKTTSKKKQKKTGSNVRPKSTRPLAVMRASESLCEAVGWSGGGHNVCYCAFAVKPHSTPPP